MTEVHGVNGTRLQNINLTAMQREKSSCPSVSFRRSADTYVLDTGEYTTKPASRLTSEAADSLAKKYDVKNMTRGEYGNLLKDLRDLGVISSKDFSVGFGGAVPYNGPSGLMIGTSNDPGLDPWPFGQEKTDFTKLLRSCAQYCKNFSYSQNIDGKGEEICSSLSDSYNRLLEIFDQIEKSSKQWR